MASGGVHEVEQLGVFTPKPMPVDSLSAGEVGFVIAGIKKVSDVAIGDTLTDERKPAPTRAASRSSRRCASCSRSRSKARSG